MPELTSDSLCMAALADTEGIGPVAIARLRAAAARQGAGLAELLAQPAHEVGAAAGLSRAAVAGLRRLREPLAAGRELVARSEALGVRVMGKDCTEGGCALRMWEESRLELPEDFPFTAIYSRRDGIADWRACIDPAGEAREVRTSHTGMALDPVVIDIVVETLTTIHNQPLDRRVVTELRAPERRAG